MRKLIMILLFIVVMSTFSQKILESKNEIQVLPSIFEIKTEASTLHVSNQDFSVKTLIKGNDVYIECYVRDYRFVQSNNKELASIAVFLDGKKQSERKTAAFIIKDMSNGKHTIKLDLIKGNGEKTGLTKEFEVHIQSAI
jgi:hypothetical protein